MVESMKSSVEEREDAMDATSEELSRGQVEVVESSWELRCSTGDDTVDVAVCDVYDFGFVTIRLG